MSSAKSPLFSIIVPVYREQENINGCLRHLGGLAGIDRSEVIIVDGDGGSTLRAAAPGPYPFCLLTLACEKGRGTQLAAGVRAASGKYLVFLHVDTMLPANGLPLVARTLDSYDAGAFSLDVIESGFLSKTWLCYVNARKRLSFTPYGDQALFMSRRTYRRAGGFPGIPIMEDVALTRRLKRGPFRVKLLHSRVCTSNRRWRRHGYLANFLRNTALYLLYRMGVSPWRLAAWYRPESTEA